MRAWRRGTGVVVACFTILAAPVRAQDSSSTRTARITYLTSVSAYIDAGREAGLREGALVQVIRSGAVFGTLKVAFLASRQASCDIVTATGALVVGDSVRFTAASPARDSTVATRPPVPVPVSSSSRVGSTSFGATALRGRVGAHYLVVAQDGGGGFTQPSLDLRLDGRPFGGGPLGVAVDIRARRTASNIAGATVVDGRARAYQLALVWNASGSASRVTLGRQLAPRLPAIGLFDGVLAEVNKPQWSAGVFGGSQPEPLKLEFSTDIVEVGTYVQRRGTPGQGAQWSATLGVSGSYQQGHANREFGFLQWFFSSRNLTTFISQEIDYYRPWKRPAGMAAISPTSTFATARYGASDRLEFHVGFDNRRNVFLYRDFVNPVTSFDDAFRQGVWAGVGLRFGRGGFGGFDVRQSSGGTAGRANSYTLSAGTDRISPLGVRVRGRSTYFQSPNLDGWLHSLGLAFDPGNLWHVELSGGARLEHDALAIPADQSILWGGLDLDMNLARSWYLMLSANAEHGGPEATSQVYGGLSVRF